MRKALAVMLVVAGVALVGLGFHNARVDSETGPEPVAAAFLEAFLAGDAAQMRALSDLEADFETALNDSEPIDGVRYRIRSTDIDDEQSSGTCLFTLTADKDFIRGKVELVRAPTGWLVRGMQLDVADRLEESVSELSELDGLPGVTVKSLE